MAVRTIRRSFQEKHMYICSFLRVFLFVWGGGAVNTHVYIYIYIYIYVYICA